MSDPEALTELLLLLLVLSLALFLLSNLALLLLLLLSIPPQELHNQTLLFPEDLWTVHLIVIVTGILYRFLLLPVIHSRLQSSLEKGLVHQRMRHEHHRLGLFFTLEKRPHFLILHFWGVRRLYVEFPADFQPLLLSIYGTAQSLMRTVGL